jgi:hypothetical protein
MPMTIATHEYAVSWRALETVHMAELGAKAVPALTVASVGNGTAALWGRGRYGCPELESQSVAL